MREYITNAAPVDYKQEAIDVLKNDVWFLLDVINNSDTRIASDFWDEVKSIKERHKFYGYEEK